MLELAIGLTCACLPSANLLVEKWMGPKLALLSPQRRVEKTTRPGSATDGTSSTYWSSLKSIIVPSTMRTFKHRSDLDLETRMSRRRSEDAELGNQLEAVVFNNRLDVPSIASTGDDRSRPSRESNHQGLGEVALEVSERPLSRESIEEKKDSVMDYESFMTKN